MGAYIRYFAVIINFFLGYSHLYRKLIQNFMADEQSANNEMITFFVYIIVTLSSLILFFPEIRFGIRHFTKESINDILSLTVLTMICSAGLVFVCQLFGVSYIPGDATIKSVYGVIISLILSPIYEEILCRGVIFRLSLNCTKSAIVAIAISTIIFAIFHIDISAQVFHQEFMKTTVMLCLGLGSVKSFAQIGLQPLA